MIREALYKDVNLMDGFGHTNYATPTPSVLYIFMHNYCEILLDFKSCKQRTLHVYTSYFTQCEKMGSERSNVLIAEIQCTLIHIELNNAQPINGKS